MKLRTRTPPSSPIKNAVNSTRQQQLHETLVHKNYEESSDWSCSSSSPLSEDTQGSTITRTSSTSPRRSSNRLNLAQSTIVAPSPIRSSKRLTIESSSEEDEKAVESNFGKRPIVLEPSSDIFSDHIRKGPESELTTYSEDVDIMHDIDNSNSAFTTDSIADPSLQGLLEDDEIDLEQVLIDESDRKLYEMAFNRTEITSNAGNTGQAAYGGMFKNRTKVVNKQANSSTVRGKGKDLFSVLKQRVRGPTIPSIRKIYFGTDVAINPWYSAPYPSEYHSESGELWICEFCLQYMKKPCTAQRHLLKCHGKLPPGDEIYRDPVAGISVFEINGRDAKLYCQNLCLLAKMFLDHKTLYYDVDPFLFYVLIEWKALGTGRFLNSFVGYFSKEKINPAGFNVSCILTMPHHQRKGYGSFLIDFSYLLSRREGRLGSPEKPLSDLGLFSYVSYWKTRLLSYFSELLPEDLNPDHSLIPSLETICASTGMTENDVLSTLEYLRMLRFDIIPDPADPSRQTLQASILIDKVAIEIYRAKYKARPQLVAKEEYLRWQPYNCTK